MRTSFLPNEIINKFFHNKKSSLFLVVVYTSILLIFSLVNENFSMWKVSTSLRCLTLFKTVELIFWPVTLVSHLEFFTAHCVWGVFTLQKRKFENHYPLPLRWENWCIFEQWFEVDAEAEVVDAVLTLALNVQISLEFIFVLVLL